MPGEIRFFDERGEISDSSRYPCKEVPGEPALPGSLAHGGERGTALGTNMFVPLPAGEGPGTDGMGIGE